MSALGRLVAWLLALAVVALPVIAVLNGWFASERWPIERMRLNAEFQRVDEDAVRTAVAPHLAAGFFAADIDRVREAVSALPWVESVEVRKHWPDLVEITLIEHRAYARWGDDRLVSARGVLFAAPDSAAMVELPQLQGPDSRLDEVLRMHQKVHALFERHRLHVDTLRLSPRGSWSLVLDSGARVVAGRGDPLPRLERFARSLPRLLAVETRVLERADLRYANGFSLRWGAAGSPSGQQQSAQNAKDAKVASLNPRPSHAGCPTHAPASLAAFFASLASFADPLLQTQTPSANRHA
jgi:cell division protein FtsQ